MAARHDSTAALLIVGGATCLSVSAMFVKLSGVNAGTTAFLRCAIALLVLLPLAGYEVRKHGRLPAELCVFALAAGVFLGVDYVLWAASILDIGAAIATVLINVQVIAFPVIARIFGRSRMSRRFLIASPVMIIGVALVSGALGHSPQVRHPVVGSLLGIAAGVAYAAYLHLNRLSGQRSPRHVITPVCIGTASAALAAAVISMLTTGIDLDLDAAAWGWMIALALLGQVAAWLLISTATPRLAPNVSATLLLLQPVLAIVVALIVLHETPVASQLIGCVVVIAAVWYANSRPTAAVSG